MTTKLELPILPFASQADWEAWLSQQPDGSNGLWLKIAKKASGIPSVDYLAALDSALCYGWIDSQKAPFDEHYFLQKFTPRRPKSKWSRANRERVEALQAAGRMQPGGLRQVANAMEDGRWETAYDSQSKISVPQDFQTALDQHPEAAAFFLSLDGANRYAVLYRIQTATNPDMRAARLQKLIAMLEKGQKIHPNIG